jgi:hypothetical protein
MYIYNIFSQLYKMYYSVGVLLVPDAPVVPPGNQVVTATLGTTETLTCNVDANPEPSYVWTFGVTQVGTGRTLDLVNVTADNDGEYVCTATNTEGEGTLIITVNAITGGGKDGEKERGSMCVPSEVREEEEMAFNVASTQCRSFCDKLVGGGGEENISV